MKTKLLTLNEEVEMEGAFVLYGRGGSVAKVSEVHRINPSRRKRNGARCTVLLAEVVVGQLETGEEIFLRDKKGNTVADDIVGRLEIDCRRHERVKKGASVGILLMENPPKKFLDLGMPLHKNKNGR